MSQLVDAEVATNAPAAMGVGAATRSAIRHSFIWRGRASLSQFWWPSLTLGVLSLVLGVSGLVTWIMGAFSLRQRIIEVGNPEVNDPLLGADMSGVGLVWFGVGVLLLALSAIVAFPLLALTVRRMHDCDWSGRWAGLAIALTAAMSAVLLFTAWESALTLGMVVAGVCALSVQIIGTLIFIITLMPGQPHENRFGPGYPTAE